MVGQKERGKQIALDIIAALDKLGIKSYIWALAGTGSAYIRFENNLMGSVRIGDHDGIEKYKYKWNVRFDLNQNGWKKEGEHWRFYCTPDSIAPLILKLKEHYLGVKDKTPKFQYNIPEHKRRPR
jgi:hypothetical protein